MSALEVDTHNGSRRSDVTVVGRHSVADAAHRNFGHSIVELERINVVLARAFQILEERTTTLREAGTRAEPVFDHIPLIDAAYSAWKTEQVGAAPIPPIVG